MQTSKSPHPFIIALVFICIEQYFIFFHTMLMHICHASNSSISLSRHSDTWLQQELQVGNVKKCHFFKFMSCASLLPQQLKFEISLYHHCVGQPSYIILQKSHQWLQLCLKPTAMNSPRNVECSKSPHLFKITPLDGIHL